MDWGDAVSLSTILPILALVLILLWLPETKGQEFEKSNSI